MCLLNEIDECLSSNESFEERLVFTHILDIVIEVKNVICTISFIITRVM